MVELILEDKQFKVSIKNLDATDEGIIDQLLVDKLSSKHLKGNNTLYILNDTVDINLSLKIKEQVKAIINLLK